MILGKQKEGERMGETVVYCLQLTYQKKKQEEKGDAHDEIVSRQSG